MRAGDRREEERERGEMCGERDRRIGGCERGGEGGWVGRERERSVIDRERGVL